MADGNGNAEGGAKGVVGRMLKSAAPWLAVVAMLLSLFVYIGGRDQRIAKLEAQVAEVAGEYRESRKAFEGAAARFEKVADSLNRVAESLARLEGRLDVPPPKKEE